MEHLAAAGGGVPPRMVLTIHSPPIPSNLPPDFVTCEALEALAEHVGSFIRSLSRARRRSVRLARDAVYEHIEGLLTGALPNAPFALTDLLRAVSRQLAVVASQGIVVGGSFAPEVRILNNTLSGVAQGIHVGLSHNRGQPAVNPILPAPLAEIDSSGRTFISGNTVHVLNRADGLGKRHGIYSGNCANTNIVANVVRVESSALALLLPSTGIQAIGQFGPLFLVHENEIIDARHDFRVRAINPAAQPTSRWRVYDNVSRGLVQPIPDITPAMP